MLSVAVSDWPPLALYIYKVFILEYLGLHSSNFYCYTNIILTEQFSIIIFYIHP